MIPGEVRLGLDIRAVDPEAYRGVAREIAEFGYEETLRRLERDGDTLPRR